MLLFADGFDHYSATQGGRKWSQSRNNFGANFISAGNGRWGDSAFWSSERWGYWDDPAGGDATWIAGGAMRIVSSADSWHFCSFWEGGTIHLNCRVSNIGEVSVWRADSVQLGTSVPIPGYVANGWNYYELKAACHDSTGTVVVRVNGSELINLTGQDTRNGGTGVFDRFRIGSPADTFPSGGAYHDDLYLCNTDGSFNNDFLGDIRVEALQPNANGTTSQLVGSDGNSTDNYLLVDEITADDETTYVQSGTPGDKDTYNFDPVTPTSGSVYGVILYPVVRKTDAGTRTIKTIARLSATEVDSAERFLATSYGMFPDVREEKPGGGAWTIPDVNDAEFGMKVFA